jgi:hypothetical protein
VSDVQVLVISDEEVDLAEHVEQSGLRRLSSDHAAALGLDPVSATIVVGAALAAARFVLSLIDRVRGGLRIDLGTRPPTLERDGAIPFRTIIVFTADDNVEIRTDDEPKDAIERIVTALFSIPAAASAAAVRSTVDTAKGAGGAP